MAQERSDIEKTERKDAADYSMSESSRADDEMSIEAENIKDQIEETRNQMGETIDAIQDKLSFTNISGQVSDHVHNAVETAKEAVYDATIGKAANIMKNITDDISTSTVVNTAKNNPLPFILIGAGAGLLAYKGLSGKLNSNDRHGQAGFRYSTLKSSTPSSDDAQRGTLGQVSDKISTTTEHAVDKVSTALDSAYAGAGAMVDRASESMDNVRSAAVDKYESYLRNNPLALGAAALAVGAAVGMAIPATVYESRLMGQTRDDLLDKAQDTATGLLDKTKQAIADAGNPLTTQKGLLKEH